MSRTKPTRLCVKNSNGGWYTVLLSACWDHGLIPQGKAACHDKWLVRTSWAPQEGRAVARCWTWARDTLPGFCPGLGMAPEPVAMETAPPAVWQLPGNQQ